MEFPSFLSLSILFPFLALALTYLSRRRQALVKKPKPNRQAGTLSEVIKNGHRILDWTTELLAASSTHTVTTYIGVITANPSNIEHILKTKFDNYPKGDRSVTLLEDFLGRGIFNSDGDHWRLQRKTASLEFNTKTIRTFVMDGVRLEVTARLLPILAKAAKTGEVIDLLELLECFAFDNVCKVAFNEDPARLGGETAEGAEFARAFEEASDLCVERYQHPFMLSWKLKRLLGIGSERRLREKIDTVHGFAMRVVRNRKKAGQAGLGDDLLSRFIAEADYSDEFLRDIIISFVLAGRDTTSATLTWFFWLISTRPAVQAKILEEIQAVREKSGEPGREVFTLDEVRAMDYMHAALSETLRLYPPVPLQMRSCAADDILPDGTAVARGTTVMYNSYAMGRMETIWGPDCREFRPERWLEKGAFQPKSPFRFPVFHAGPRMCLGKEMAYIQMKAVAAAVMERFEIEVLDKERQRETAFTMILKVKGGLPVRVRENSAAVTPARAG